METTTCSRCAGGSANSRRDNGNAPRWRDVNSAADRSIPVPEALLRPVPLVLDVGDAAGAQHEIAVLSFSTASPGCAEPDQRSPLSIILEVSTASSIVLSTTSPFAHLQRVQSEHDVRAAPISEFQDGRRVSLRSGPGSLIPSRSAIPPKPQLRRSGRPPCSTGARAGLCWLASLESGRRAINDNFPLPLRGIPRGTKLTFPSASLP